MQHAFGLESSPLKVASYILATPAFHVQFPAGSSRLQLASGAKMIAPEDPDETNHGSSTALILTFTFFMLGACLMCLGINLVPAVVILVTMLGLGILLCLCRVCTKRPNHDNHDPTLTAPRHKQVWASLTLAEMESASVDFRLVQFGRSPSSSPRVARNVLGRVSVPAAVARRGDQPACACCMDDFVSEEALAMLPCGHVFHEECIMQWFLTDLSDGVCPMCRARVLIHAHRV